MAGRRAWLLIVPALLLVALVHWLDPWGFQAQGPQERARTDAAGRDALAADGAKGPRLEAGEGGKRPPAASEVRFPPGTWPASLSDVDRNLDLHGLVVTREGVPVAGARVRTTRYPWRSGGLLTDRRYDEGETEVNSTGTDGSFRVRVRPGERVDLVIDPLGYAPVRLRDRLAGERVRVVVEPGVSLFIRTSTPEGGPAADVLLVVSAHGTPPQNLRTNASGLAEAAPIPSGVDVEVGVKVQPGWAWKQEDVRVPAGAREHRLEIALVRARALAGRVTDAADGRPVAGAEVGAGWTMEASVTTDAQGRYVFTGWPSNGYFELAVLSEGYGREEVRVGAREVVDVALTKGCDIVGRVVGPEGAPLAQVQVAAMGSEVRESGQRISLGDGVSGADGRFRVGGLRHDMVHELVLQAAGLGRALHRVPAMWQPGAEVDVGDLRMVAGRTIAGRVLDAAGHARADIEVRLLGPAVVGDDAGPSDYGRSEEGRSDDLGRFRFGDLPAGRYQLMAVEQEPVRTARQVELPADEDRLAETLTLPAARRIRVEPVDLEGRLVLPVEFRARWAGGRRQRGLHRKDDLDVVLPGPALGLTVTLNAIDGSDLGDPEPVRVADDATVVRLVFVRLGVLTGRLVDEKGVAIPNATVYAARGAEAVGSASVSAAGDFRLGVPGADPVTLRFDGRVWAPGEENYLEEIVLQLVAELGDVRPGAQGLRLVARPVAADRTFTLRVLDPEGRPVPALALSVSPRPSGGRRILLTDSGGRLVLTGLTPAALSFRALVPEGRREDWWGPPTPATVPNGQTLELRLRRPRFVEGVVVRADGSVLAGATVSSDSFEERSASTLADAQGRFRLPLDPDGAATVDLEAIAGDETGPMWRAVASDVPVGGAPVRLVAEPHDGIVR